MTKVEAIIEILQETDLFVIECNFRMEEGNTVSDRFPCTWMQVDSIPNAPKVVVFKFIVRDKFHIDNTPDVETLEFKECDLELASVEGNTIYITTLHSAYKIHCYDGLVPSERLEKILRDKMEDKYQTY